MKPLAPVSPPLQVVLVSPQIPPNAGNVVRTCAVTGSRLHLVGPLGFSLDDRHLRRAGLDHWPDVQPEVYRDWQDFAARALGGQPSGCIPSDRLHLFTARASRTYLEAVYAPGDFLFFGHEQLGLPPALLDAWPERQRAIPMLAGKRSLNLAVAVGVALYAALAQLGGPGGGG
jgi:tRNA (cytidine/uridine-2'-O-)-methyltransferase